MQAIVIIGSGHAGISLAREIRALDATVPVVIVTRETGELYYKPNLSKALSMGKTADALVMKTASQIRQELNLQILTHTEVLRVDTESRSLSLLREGAAENLSYASLVFAAGAKPLDLGLSDAVMSINNLEDYRQFRKVLVPEQRILILGAGFVGCELASDLAGAGHQIDVVDLNQWPIQRVIPRAMGMALMASFPQDQVRWHLATGMTKLVSANSRPPQSENVDHVGSANYVATLSDGTALDVDLVVSAVGLAPNITLAQQAGIRVNRGIRVDRYLQTSVDGVYALGDCAEYESGVMPFILPASQAAKALARTLSGNRQAMNMPMQAVAVKVAYCPLVICPPNTLNGVTSLSAWQVEGMGQDLSAVCYDSDGAPIGFALSGKAITQKNLHLKRIQSPTEAIA